MSTATIAKPVQAKKSSRKYKVLAEMLGNHQGRHSDGSPNEVDGGYKAGSIVTAEEIEASPEQLQRLIDLKTIEPLILMVPAPDLN